MIRRQKRLVLQGLAIASLALTLVLTFAPAAHSQDGYPDGGREPPERVEGEFFVRPSEAGAPGSVGGGSGSGGGAGSLPFTGLDLWLPLAVAAALITTGAVLYRRNGRPNRTRS